MICDFDSVYNKIVRTLIGVGLPRDGSALPPTFMAMDVIDGNVKPINSWLMDDYFGQAARADAVHVEIKRMAADSPDSRFFALMSEASILTIKTDPSLTAGQNRARFPDDVAEHPMARRCIAIGLYAGDAFRPGYLPVDEAGRITYSPLRPAEDIARGAVLHEYARK